MKIYYIFISNIIFKIELFLCIRLNIFVSIDFLLLRAEDKLCLRFLRGIMGWISFKGFLEILIKEYYHYLHFYINLNFSLNFNVCLNIQTLF
mgnify:CR=1 FL=1|jgi:hypothetical protein